MTNTEIAETILMQMGGINRIHLMTGAKHFLALENGVSFRYPGSEHSNYVKIILNGKDLYDVEFGKIRNVKGVPTYKLVETMDDLYFDMLKPIFEQHTRLYLSL
jgi:hypothetical protein